MVSMTSCLQEDIKDWTEASKKPLTNEMLEELEDTFTEGVGDKAHRESQHTINCSSVLSREK